MKVLRIGNSSGFWGDDPTALFRMASAGELDYITCDYLAEVSMSILSKQQQKQADLGYVADFLKHLDKALPHIQKNNIKIITNAGGNNPKALAIEVQNIVKAQNLTLKVAYVEGDNIMHLLQQNPSQLLYNMESKEGLSAKKIVTANAYIGIAGLLEALKMEADIVIAGRVTDSALAIAPMVHELNWKLDDYDKLGAGMIAAHCIECGTQVTGGNFTDWKEIKAWYNIGFPILEMQDDGIFFITKHQQTGGIVTVNTVKEQLVYEIADPGRYFSPDVLADLRQLKLEQVSENKVKISNAKGTSASSFYKVSATYQEGYRAMGELIISGPDALEKAILFQSVFWEKVKINFYRKNVEYVGYNACHGNLVTNHQPNEILLRLYVHDMDFEKVKTFSEMVASLILSGPQGVAVVGGRPRIQEVMAYWPFLIPKNEVKINVVELESGKTSRIAMASASSQVAAESDFLDLSQKIEQPTQGKLIALSEICLARSGDKGNAVNIGVIARNHKAFIYLKTYLLPSLLKQWFGEKVLGNIKRYELPSLLAFNFMLEEALDGGGTKALRIDAQGKTFAAALLSQKVYVPDEFLNE